MAEDEITIHGKTVDKNTRCIHYHSDLDIIAIKFKCCYNYYPCYHCHEESTHHKLKIWEKTELDTKAIFCGNCKNEMTINQYLNAENICIYCSSKFNPKCSLHYHLYFDNTKSE